MKTTKRQRRRRTNGGGFSLKRRYYRNNFHNDILYNYKPKIFKEYNINPNLEIDINKVNSIIGDIKELNFVEILNNINNSNTDKLSDVTKLIFSQTNFNVKTFVNHIKNKIKGYDQIHKDHLNYISRNHVLDKYRSYIEHNGEFYKIYKVKKNVITELIEKKVDDTKLSISGDTKNKIDEILGKLYNNENQYISLDEHIDLNKLTIIQKRGSKIELRLIPIIKELNN